MVTVAPVTVTVTVTVDDDGGAGDGERRGVYRGFPAAGKSF